MALDRTFAVAFIDNNVRHRILGRRLHSFSLWHRYLLMAAGSPFLAGGNISFFDIREAVGICSLRWPKCKVRRPWVIPFVYFMLMGYRRKAWKKWMIRLRDRLLEYFGDYISRPEYSIYVPEIPRSGGPQLAPPPRLGPVPEEFIVLSDVIGFLHCSLEEAWNTPVSQAYWWQMAFYKHKGESINFFDENERQFQAQMRAAAQKKTA